MAVDHFGKIGGSLGMGLLVSVVEADADEFPGIGDGRVEPHGRRGMDDAIGERGHRLLRGRPAFQERARALGDERCRDLLGAHYSATGERGGQTCLQVDDVITFERAEARAHPVVREANKLHDVGASAKEL
jgi:hypothetical protein